MVRFNKQYDNYSCGPVAILNALKWAGYNCTYKQDFHFIKELCECVNEPDWQGTHYLNLSSALKEYRIKFKFIRKPSLFQIVTHLEKGGAVILRVLFKEEENHQDTFFGHYFLCFDFDSKKSIFKVVNYLTDKTQTELEWNELEEILEIDVDPTHYHYTKNGRKDINSSIGWFVKRS